MDFFDNLKEREQKMKSFEELKREERQLYNEREKLFKSNQERDRETVEELANQVKKEFKIFFMGKSGFVLQQNNTTERITVESKTLLISIEQLDEWSFSFSLVEKDTDNYSNNLHYSILIEETDETIYYCTYNGLLTDDGKLIYTGKFSGDTIDGVKEQIDKLKNDINIISSKTEIPRYVFKLCDNKLEYLNKEFQSITDLFKEILSKYKF